MTYPFIKMNGLGNDFLIVLDPAGTFSPPAGLVRRLAGREDGRGCDQLICLSRSRGADAGMRIWNADGSSALACGNATRCVGWLVTEAAGRARATLATPTGTVQVTRAGEQITVDMGAPRLGWRDIPLARATDTRQSDIRFDPELGSPGFVSMGNPHAVFFTDHVEDIDVGAIGPRIETDPLFPDRVNVAFAQVLSAERIRVRMWERGAGQTRACGTGACAALVAAHRRGLTGSTAVVVMEGGELHIDWAGADGHVRMTGSVEVEFTGRLEV